MVEIITLMLLIRMLKVHPCSAVPLLLFMPTEFLPVAFYTRNLAAPMIVLKYFAHAVNDLQAWDTCWAELELHGQTEYNSKEM